MVELPIYVERHPYRGRDPNKLRNKAEYDRDACLLESYINEKAQEGKSRFLYSDIAVDVGMTVGRVSEILFSVDCGHNGFTIQTLGDDE